MENISTSYSKTVVMMPGLCSIMEVMIIVHTQFDLVNKNSSDANW